MNINQIKSIQFSLLKRETDVKDCKAEYTKKKSAKFIIPKDFFKDLDEKETVKELISSMFSDLKTDAPSDVDSLGLWIEYESITVDNAISLNTLGDILEYSKEPVNPIYEFFMMTLNQ